VRSPDLARPTYQAARSFASATARLRRRSAFPFAGSL